MDGSTGSQKGAPKMMLGFIVRRCAADIGHTPTPDEFAAWANGLVLLIALPLSATIAQIMFRQPGRLVTVRPGGLVRDGAERGR